MKEKSELAGVKVLLLEGFARQTMPIMQALHDLGCHITTYNNSRLDLGYLSRYPDKKLLAFWDRNDAKKSLIALVKVLQADHYDIVIPMTDFSATLLSKYRSKLEKYAYMAVNEWTVFQNAGDKQNTMMLCMENGIPCPYTLRDIQCVEDILASDIKYPFIIKPRVGYGSIGFHCIHNEEELRQVFDKTKESCGDMLVQEYIPQTDIQYKCEVFIDQYGDVKSAVVFDKTRWYPIDGGSTCCSASVNRPDIVESSVKLLKAMGWRGYGDVDLIQDPRDKVAKVMEVNPRITASVKVCFAAGVDFARQIVELGIGRKVTEYKTYKIDKRLRYMHTDILWFIESKDRFKAKPSWFSFKNTTDQIWSLKDPLPWFGYTIEGLLKFKKEKNKRKR